MVGLPGIRHDSSRRGSSDHKGSTIVRGMEDRVEVHVGTRTDKGRQGDIRFKARSGSSGQLATKS